MIRLLRVLGLRTGRLGSRPAGYLGMIMAVAVTVSACGPSITTGSGVASSSSTAAGPTVNATYQLHMDFFSQESKLPSVIDPQVFVSKPGAPAGTGPQMIQHAAGVTPASKTDPPATPLLGADGAPLGITLGQWENAAGSLSWTCAGGRETAVARLSGLIPNAVYSVFVVHLAVQGAGRFTPFGDADRHGGRVPEQPGGRRGDLAQRSSVAWRQRR